MLELPAPAKINLHLAVTGKTATGFHTLDTSFAYVDVNDSLFIESADHLHVTCSDPDLNTRNNLVFRVLEAMRSTFSVKQAMKVHVEKILPVQAGLGGGSSDAATAIIAANTLWRLNLDSKTLIEFAAPYGADIPCFLFGRASRAEGVGEKLAPLGSGIEGRHLVLAHPGVGLSTARVFARYDRNHVSPAQLTPPGTKDTIRASLPGDKNTPLPLGKNGLEAVACGMCPELFTLLEYMREGGRCAWMSGSGTACVALAKDTADTQMLAHKLKRKGVAAWVHAGCMLQHHPLCETGSKPADWGVAKW